MLSAERTRLVAPKTNREIAEHIVAEVRGLTGVSIPLITDCECETDPTVYRHCDLIVVGNLQDNQVMARLYFAGKAFLDAAFPGRNGYVVKTLADPFDCEHDVVLVGGSSAEGTQEAAKQFVSLVATYGTELPRLHAVVSHLLQETLPSYEEAEHGPVRMYLRESVGVNALPSEHLVSQILEQNVRNFEIGRGADSLNNAISYGMRFHFTGNPVWARLFTGTLLGYVHLAQCRGGWDFDPMIASYFRLSRLIQTWELVEHDSYIRKEDRDEISTAFLEVARHIRNSSYARLSANLPGEPRQNHSTFVGLSLDAAIRHFGRLGYDEVAEWREVPDRIFAGQLTSYRSDDDAARYAWYSLLHTFDFYQRRGCDSTGCGSAMEDVLNRLHQAADLAIMVSDNRRDEVTYGDAGSYVPWSETSWPNTATVLSRALWGRRDPGHQWAYRWLTEGHVPPLGLQLYAVDQTAEEPNRLSGVSAVFLDDSAINCIASRVTKYSWLPREGNRYFDKISFRSSFRPNDEYLLLDGIAAFAHSHQDANSVARLTWQDRIWLVDLDYIRALPRYHNSIEVCRDGLTETLPPLSALTAKANFKNVALVCTTLESDNGVDWSRHVFWAKRSYFLFLDKLHANRAGEYDLTCRWRVLGEPELHDRCFEVHQTGARFHVINLDTSRLSLVAEESRLSSWTAYPYADAVVRVLNEKLCMPLSQGQSTQFVNLLYARGETDKEKLKAWLVVGGVVVVEGLEGLAVMGTAQESRSIGYVRLSADMFHMTEHSMTAANISHLEISTGCLKFTRPVCMELNSDGSGTLVSTGRSKVVMTGSWSIGGGGIATTEETSRVVEIDSGEYEVMFAPISFITALEIREWKSHFEKPSLGPSKSIVNFGLKDEWTIELGAAITAAEPLNQDGSDDWAIGLENGRVFSLNSQGEAKFCGQVAGTVRAVLREGEMLFVGDTEGVVTALAGNGNVLWKHELGWGYGRKERVVKICLQPHTDHKRLIVGTEGWKVHAFDLQGSQIWTTAIRYHAVTDLAIADLDLDGRNEIVVGTEYHTPINILGYEGDLRWFTWEMVGSEARATTPYVGTHARIIVATHLSKDTGPLIVFGTETDEVVALGPDSTVRWSSNVGGEVNALIVRDLDGDGSAEIIVGTSSGYLVMLDSLGRRRWWRRAESGITALDIASGGTVEEARIVVGHRDGTLGAYTKEGSLVAIVRKPSPICRLKVSKNGKLLCATTSGSVFCSTLKPHRPLSMSSRHRY
jgi:outer membrane protein assembly factor BamB